MSETTKIVFGVLGGGIGLGLIYKFFSMRKSGHALSVDEEYRNNSEYSGGTRRKQNKSRRK